MLDNIGGYQVDKVKFAMELDAVQAAMRSDEFRAAVDTAVGPRNGRTYNVVSVKKGAVDGTYLYVFDVWGEASAQVDALDFSLWYPHLSRVDLKTPMPMTAEGLSNYHDFLQDVAHGKRSVRLNDSPVRQKRGDRDAGGYSLALGSHKSDYRVHWTLRGDEVGYQEFQLDGKRVYDAISATKHYERTGEGPEGRVSWDGIMRALLIMAQVELSDIDGLYDSDRAAILQGRTDIHGVMERKLASIERDIDHLPKDALFALLVALNEKVFGTPPEANSDIDDDDDANAIN